MGLRISKVIVPGFMVAGLCAAQTTISIPALQATDRKLMARQSHADGPGSGSVGGPTLGFVFDPATTQIRRIAGIAGVAALAEAYSTDFALHEAWPAPQQDYLLATTADGGQVAVIRTGEGRIIGAQILEDVPAAPDRVEFSPSGRCVGLHFRESGLLTVLSELPLSPVVSAAWDLSEWGAPTAIAIHDNGSTALAAFSDGQNGRLVLLEDARQPRVVAAIGEASAIRFVWSGRDAVFADRLRNAVYALRDVAGAAATVLLAGEADGVSKPVQLGIGHDSRLVAILLEDSPDVLVIDTEFNAARRLVCSCTPRILRPLKDLLTFQLTEPGTGRVFALDANPEMTRIFPIVGELGELAACPDSPAPPQLHRPDKPRWGPTEPGHGLAATQGPAGHDGSATGFPRRTP